MRLRHKNGQSVSLIRLSVISVSISLTLMSHTAFSQDSESSDKLEVIEVTALKRTQDLQKAAVSIDVLSAEMVEKGQLDSVEDIANMTSGLTMDALPKSQPRPSIRGIGSSDTGAGSDQSTAVYIDNVYMSRPGFISFDSFDIQRIEVVKGPQGTLWGKNVVGGLIHVITNKPVEFEEAKVLATVGSDGIVNGNLMINIPLLNEKLLSRLVINSSHNDGYAYNANTGNKIADSNKVSGRLHLMYNASDSVELGLKISGIHEKNGGAARTLMDAAIPDLSIDPDGDIRQVSSEVDGFDNKEVFSVTSTVNWDMDFADLEIIANHKELDLSFLEDFDGTNMLEFALSGNEIGDPLQIQRIGEENTTSKSVEIRLSSELESGAYWQVGYFFEKDDIEQSNTDGIFSGLCFTDSTIGAEGNYASAIAAAVAGGLGFPDSVATQYGQAIASQCVGNESLSDYAASQTFDQKGDVTSHAIFGEISFDLSEKYALTLGARYSKDEKKFAVDSSRSILSFQLLANGYPNGFGEVIAEDSWEAVTYKATIDGQFTKDTFGYFTVSSGYKSGGFQNNPLSPEAVLDSFEPEEATNFEFGLKTQMFDDRLRLNSAIFYQPHEDMQLRQVVGTISQTVNAGEAEIKGAEINASITFFDDLDLRLNYSYIDARFEKYVDNGNDRSGNRVSGTPKHSLALTARYNMDSPFGFGGYMYLAGNVTYKDKIYLDSSNLPPEILYSTTLVDSTLVYNLDNWEVSVWVKNITDEDYKTHYAQVYNSYATYGAPRRVGISANWTF